MCIIIKNQDSHPTQFSSTGADKPEMVAEENTGSHDKSLNSSCHDD